MVERVGHGRGAWLPLRAAVEAQAFRVLAQRRHVPPAATEAITALNRISSRSPQRDFVEADLAFHSAIVHGTRNARLIRVHDGLRAEILLLLAQLAIRYPSVRQLAREHNELVTAITHGTPTEAEATIRAHLERAAEWLAAHASAVEPHPRPRRAAPPEAGP
ncbi:MULTISPECIES: FCD domain-containing protein [unclassified Micromonospora]|uniref:FCD domain-containing protein n=1 Tax=unclassified Micromonospora TaxID=2617518 RepID=UPI00333294C4